MPSLSFHITGAEPASDGLTPLLHFALEVANTPAEEAVRGAVLKVQIRFEPAWRAYAGREQERLADLFGPPERWRDTLRSRLWTHVQTSVRPFSGRATTVLPVPCTYDLNVAAAKYLYALEDGDVPLLFLFSGSVYFAAPDGALRMEQIPWDAECTYRMPVRTWRAMMDALFPDSAWLSLRRDAFDRLYAYRLRHGLTSWEETLDRLLSADRPLPTDREVPT